jgi:hypothetical protein
MRTNKSLREFADCFFYRYVTQITIGGAAAVK